MVLDKNCSICGKTFVWQDIDLGYFKKFGFAPLDHCSDCLHMQHLCFRNERVFYHRKCDATHENIISIYHPDSSYKVYKADYFWSDKWSSLDYGQDFDFNRPFFEQFAELKLRVPRLAIHNAKAENSDYCNTSYGNKNSYMIFGGDVNEDCMFGVLCDKNKFCLDLDYSFQNELLYFCSDVANCYDSHYLFNSKVSSNCYFCEELSGCNECILCFNLKNQKFCIGNKQFSKEEYFSRKKGLIDGSFKGYAKLFGEFLEKRSLVVKKYAHMVGCQDCEGDYIVDSKNCTKCFDVARSEDSRDIIYGSKIKDCFLCDMLGLGTELAFNTLSTMTGYNVKLSFWTVDSSDLTYCDFILNSSYCFGCVGLNHGSYCILNKRYSKNEYEDLVLRIIKHMKKTGEWGQFMPARISCFGYNETTAGLYWPLSKEEAVKRGFNWRDELISPRVSHAYVIPDSIGDVKDDILQVVLECNNCRKNFRILSQELRWYKTHDVPIPRNCVNCRMKQRAGMRNPRKLWTRECIKCGMSLQSSYSSDQLEKIYCEKCYWELVFYL